MKAYLHGLKLFSKKYQVSILAKVLMTHLMHVTKYPPTRKCNRSNDAICLSFHLTLIRVTAKKTGRLQSDNQTTDNAQDNQLHTLTPII
jgi:hypothetical protein